jgi:hypothetical protein
MKVLALSLLLVSTIHKTQVTSACLRGSNSFSNNHEEHSLSPINKFLEKHFPGRLKASAENGSTEENDNSIVPSAGYWTIHFGNLAPSFQKDMTASDQKDVDLSPATENISAPSTESASEIDFNDLSSAESVYAQYGIASSYDTYDYQSYYSDDDVENGLFYIPDDDYMKKKMFVPLNKATVEDSYRSDIGNLFAIIANLQFPMILSISTTDREAIYIDGGIGDIPQSPCEQ